MTEKRRSRVLTPEGFVTRVTPSPSTLLVLLLVSVLLGPSLSLPCWKDSECPEGRICVASETKHIFEGGICVCEKGKIAWKWRCLASGKSLGDSCRISPQCNLRQRQICDPLTKTCVCEKKFNPSEQKQHFVNGVCGRQLLVMYFNSSSFNTTRDSLSVEDSSSPRFPAQGGLSDYQMSTLLYIGLSLSVVVLLGLLSLAYRKMIQEKRQSAAAIKGLLELISENQSLNSFCSTVSDEEVVIVRSDGRNSSGSNPYSISDKLHLPPLEGLGDTFSRFPDPHLSSPVLPPIKRPTLVSFPRTSLK